MHFYIDFCHGLLIEQPSCIIDRFQRVQNRSARIVSLSRYDQSATPLLIELHWLPIKFRAIYKIVTLVYKCLNNTAPKYLRELIKIEHAAYRTRSSGALTLSVSRVNNRTSERAFSVAGPRFWNSLPVTVRAAGSEATFRKMLKTHLFKQSYLK